MAGSSRGTTATVTGSLHAALGPVGLQGCVGFSGAPIRASSWVLGMAASLLTVSLISSRCPGFDPTPFYPGNKTQSPGLQAHLIYRPGY